MTNANHWATPTHELADLPGTVGDLTAKYWDELAACGDDVVAVEWTDGSPMPVAQTEDLTWELDVFSRAHPGTTGQCCSEFTPLAEVAQLAE